MSWWGSIDATFHGGHANLGVNLQDEIERRGWHVPTGSEDGPRVNEHDGAVTVYGRLRDVTDREDAAIVLGWFVRHAKYCDHAEIEFEYDSGPRYRYEWKDGTLHKLRGVLD